MIISKMKKHILGKKKILADQKGNMVWYLLASIAGIAVFYLIFFFLWGHIKGWFVTGS